MKWLSETKPSAEAILILDPDCMPIRPLDMTVVEGRPIAQQAFFNFVFSEKRQGNVAAEAAARYCKGCDFVDAVGVPILIHRRDLEKLAPRWLQKTLEMRRDRGNWPRSWTESTNSLGIGWTSEMFGYVFAAAELGIRHDIRKLHDAAPYDKRLSAPIIHYYERVHLIDGRTWNKKDAGAAWNIPWPTPNSTDAVSNMTLHKLHSALELLGPSTDAHFAAGYLGMNASRDRLGMNHDAPRGSGLVHLDGVRMLQDRSGTSPDRNHMNHSRGVNDMNSSVSFHHVNSSVLSHSISSSVSFHDITSSVSYHHINSPELLLNHDANRDRIYHDRSVKGTSAAHVGQGMGVNRGGGGGAPGGGEMVALT
jgi:hypothetical protein